MFGSFRPLSVEVFPTGSLSLDIALGVGGIPRGRIVEVYGPPASGKSTLGLHIIAEAQRRGFSTLFVDMEHSLDVAYAKKCGVDVNDALLSLPQTGIQALQIIKETLASGDVDVVVLDSIAALSPRRESLAPGNDSNPSGRVFQILPTALREISLACIRSNSSLVCTNQIRSRLRKGYGPSETSTGGMSVKFHSAIRISLKTKKLLRQNGEVVGSQIEARVSKNTVARPFRSAILNIVYNRGISKGSDLLRLGLNEKIITQRGSHYWYGEQNLGQGRWQVEAFLDEGSVAAHELENAAHELENVAQELEKVLRNRLLPKQPMSMAGL